MFDVKLDHVQQLLDRLNGDIQAIYTRYQEECDKIEAKEQDHWFRSHKIDVARARMVLEKADLEAQRHSLIRNMATMRSPIAGIVIDQN